MKRFVALLTCIIMLCCTLMFPVSAAGTENNSDDGQIVISQTVEYVGEDCYYIETIYIPNTQTYSTTKVGTKESRFISSGVTIFSIAVTGTFVYDGSTARATNASGKIVAYVDGVTLNSRSANISGATASATGSVTYMGVVLQKTVTLTCDKNGNLS